MRRASFLLLAPALFSTAGCVQVSAPEKPIEINLNVAIRQEVVVRMQRDVEQLIDQNPEAFPRQPGQTGTTTPPTTPGTPRQ